jgi:hypothetical protein
MSKASEDYAVPASEIGSEGGHEERGKSAVGGPPGLTGKGVSESPNWEHIYIYISMFLYSVSCS